MFVFYCLYLFFFLNESGMLDIYLFTITDIHIILLVIHKMSFPSSFSDQERSIPSPPITSTCTPNKDLLITYNMGLDFIHYYISIFSHYYISIFSQIHYYISIFSHIITSVYSHTFNSIVVVFGCFLHTVMHIQQE